MTQRREVAEALAALGEFGGHPGGDAAGATEHALAAEPEKRSRAKLVRRLLIGLVLLALVAGAAYWQRTPLLQALARVPLLGPIVADRQLTRPAPDPLASERAALAEQERRVAQREQDLHRAEADLARRQDALAAREAALAAQEEELARREEEWQALLPGPGIDELVDIYRNMKADAAAERLARLDNLTAITVLQRVDKQLAARILAAMDPDRAAELSRSLAAQGGS